MRQHSRFALCIVLCVHARARHWFWYSMLMVFRSNAFQGQRGRAFKVFRDRERDCLLSACVRNRIYCGCFANIRKQPPVKYNKTPIGRQTNCAASTLLQRPQHLSNSSSSSSGRCGKCAQTHTTHTTSTRARDSHHSMLKRNGARARETNCKEQCPRFATIVNVRYE